MGLDFAVSLLGNSNFYQAWPQWMVLLHYLPALAVILWNKADTIDTSAQMNQSATKRIGGQ
jgi:hypothetical protein